MLTLVCRYRAPPQTAGTLPAHYGHTPGSVLHCRDFGEICVSQEEAQEGETPRGALWHALQVRPCVCLRLWQLKCSRTATATRHTHSRTLRWISLTRSGRMRLISSSVRVPSRIDVVTLMVCGGFRDRRQCTVMDTLRVQPTQTYVLLQT